MTSWDEYFMGMARYISTKSKDRSTKVGCVIVSSDHAVLSTGYNGFCRGVNDNIESRYERPAKYKWTEHSERNAVYNAAANGVSLRGATMYLPWFPCVDCARAIIQSGICELVCHRPNFDDPVWGSDFALAYDMLTEVGIEVRFVKEEN